MIYVIILFFLLCLLTYVNFSRDFKKNFYMEYYVPVAIKPTVSIIVCARNEEDNIKALLQALLRQDYDSSKIEIIVANDGSTDGTEKILQEYSSEYPFIQYFNTMNRDNVKSPKKNALKQAIYIATGKILLMTDADCVPTPNWVSSHVTMYGKYPETDMVVGFSKTALTENFRCQLFEHIDFLVLMFAAQGAIQAGYPFSCSGQNLSYKKQTFRDVNGFQGIDKYVSGDDLLLMQKFVKHKKAVKFLAFNNSYTVTQPLNSWWELFNQRARWASNLKAMLYMNTKFFIYLLSCFVCMCTLPLIIYFYFLFLYIFSLFMYIDFNWGSIIVFYATMAFFFLIRIISDDNYIRYALSNWKLEKSVAQAENNDWDKFLNEFSVFSGYYFWLWYVVNPIYMLIVTILGLFSVFRWKKG